jgi:thiol-disulfide isomerase/thioredoxin
MRISSVIGILLSTLLLTACRPTPDAYDTQGNPVVFDSFRGQIVLINYFADWCKPCWQEIPELNKFYHQNKGKIKVFGVNADPLEAPQLNTIIKKMKIDFPVLAQDPGKKFDIMIESLPMTVIINIEGKKSKTLLGEQTVETLKQAIGNL